MKPKEYLQQYRQSMERTAEIEQHLAELKAEAIRLKDHEGYSVICTKPLTACTHGFYEWLKQEAKENARRS